MPIFRVICVAGALFLAVSNAFARPQFIVLDVADPMNRPEDLGFNITAKRVGADIHFRVEADQIASAAFDAPSIFFLRSGTWPTQFHSQHHQDARRQEATHLQDSRALR
jgi:hypothetical protein